MMSPKVSVIVPIYNVEKYLRRCLDSVAAQTFSDYEVIMIDDGSTDSSRDIAAEYAEKLPQFKLFDNAKKGVANARNVGVQNSSGEYVAFVDSDDFVAPEYLEVLYCTASAVDADISTCNYAKFYQEKGKYHTILIRKPSEKVYTNTKFTKMVLNDIRVRSYVWNKLWRRSLFTDNGIKFNDIYFEDIAICPQLIHSANKIAVTDKCLYNYTQRKGSIMSSAMAGKINGYIYTLALMRNFFENHNCYGTYKLMYGKLCFCVAFANLYNVFEVHKAHKSFKYYGRNIKVSFTAPFYYRTRKFKPVHDGDPEMIFKIKIDD